MFKPTTKGLVLFLVALNVSSQGAAAAPVPWSFKIPGIKGATYRSGSGWGDVAELNWKVEADAAAKETERVAKSSSKNGGSNGAALAGAGVGTAAITGGAIGGGIAGKDDLGYDYAG